MIPAERLTAMEHVRVDYPPPGVRHLACNCPRTVTRPHALPSLRVGPAGHQVLYPSLQADGTLTVWHQPDCDELWPT